MSDWTDQLSPASWRGVGFSVLVENGAFGRRVAMHQYPFRDTPWPEDIGRAARRPAITGFLIGPDALTQMRAMIAAAEQPGPGTLVHPTLGTMTVALIEPMTVATRWDGQQVVELEFKFVEAGQQVFPVSATSTPDATVASATNADTAAASDFATNVTSTLSAGAAVIGEAISVVNAWTGQILSLASDATSLAHMIGSLTGGNYGRYFSGARTTARLSQPTITISQLIGAGSAARAATSASVIALKTTVAALGVQTPLQLAVAAQAAIATLADALDDPQDAIRILTGLTSFSTSDPTTPDAIGIAIGVMQTSLGGVLRRAAVTALARASAGYQPSSYDDAMTAKTTVVATIDDEITTAGDNGDDASYRALRTLRANVIADLAARGADLAHLVTIVSPTPLPSLALAYRLYGDATREPELVGFANPPHPAFMPTSFRALAS